MPTRPATTADRKCFLELCKAMYEELLQYGSEITPGEDTLKEMGALFDAYVRGSLFGVVTVWCPEGDEVPAGVVMAGETWSPLAFGSNMGKQAEGWVAYVTPCHRRQNVAQFLQEATHEALEHLAFDCVVSHVFLGNEAGEANLEAHGWHRQATRYVLDLGKE